MSDRSEVLLLDRRDDGIVVLTLHRPSTLNALDASLLEALEQRFEELAHDATARVIVLTGQGPKAFCSGADLAERRTMSEADVARRLLEYRRVFGAIANSPKPTICAINGYAFGGGLEIALACDIRLMAAETKIGLTELRLGIIPGAGGTQRLARLIGPARAKELIFTAARLDAERALALGVVNASAPRETLLEAATGLAGQMLASAPLALTQAKRAIDMGLQCDLETGLGIESQCYAVLLPTDDRREGLEAFRDGRSPEFKGR